jgi:hypothetical protein
VTSLSADPIGLRIPDTTAVSGEYINIPIYVDSNLTDEGVLSYQLQISFDAALLRVNDVVISGTIGESFGQPALNNADSGQVTLAAAGIAPLSGSGVLLYIRVEPLRNGGSPFSFTNVENNFFNEGTPALILNNGFIRIGPIVGLMEINQIPHEFGLFQNYPNPFNPHTVIKYQLPVQSDVKLVIYNILGQRVRTLVNQKQDAGYYSVVWNARRESGEPVSSGIYIYQIIAGDFTKIRRMVLIH